MAVSAALGAARQRNVAQGIPNINIEFVYNMPLRAIGQMTGGITDRGLVRAIVLAARGWGLGGLVLLVLTVATGGSIGLGIALWLLWVLGPSVVALVVNALRNKASDKALKTADQSRQ